MGQALFMVRVNDAAVAPVPVDLGNALEFNRKVTAAVGALTGEAFCEVGRVQLTARIAAPPGWLICDGSEVRRSDFPALFGVIGESYGAGNGTTTFNLPTQAQCVPPAVAPTAPQVITGGSVEPTGTVPDPGPNPTSGTGGNTVTGGRPNGLRPREDY